MINDEDFTVSVEQKLKSQIKWQTALVFVNSEVSFICRTCKWHSDKCKKHFIICVVLESSVAWMSDCVSVMYIQLYDNWSRHALATVDKHINIAWESYSSNLEESGGFVLNYVELLVAFWANSSYLSLLGSTS
jgi:hypothetical protein